VSSKYCGNNIGSVGAGGVSKFGGAEPAEVSAWPTCDSAEPPADSDHDGIPDEWEKAHGFEPATTTTASIVRPGRFLHTPPQATDPRCVSSMSAFAG
jgi:hypothetical protein